MWKSLMAGALLAFSALSSVEAATVTIDATGLGWIDQSGNENGSLPTNNYLAGNCGLNDCGIGEYRNFFRFDTTSLHETMVSAVLRLNTFNMEDEQAPSLTYTITSTVGLTFANLGTGTVFGSRSYSDADDFKFFDIALNAAGIAAVGGNDFIISGRVTSPTLFGPAEPNQFVFGGADGWAQLIVVTVPEPATWAMVLVGLAGLGVGARRRGLST